MNSLDRFREAQDRSSVGYEVALAEMRVGRKESHWIWYIFPQLEGLGQSPMAHHYAIRNLEEAWAYLQDSTLRRRLLEVARAAAAALEKGVTVTELMGSETDALKLVSSLTLFEQALAGRPETVTQKVLGDLDLTCAQVLSATTRQGYPRCRLTLERLKAEKEQNES